MVLYLFLFWILVDFKSWYQINIPSDDWTFSDGNFAQFGAADTFSNLCTQKKKSELPVQDTTENLIIKFSVLSGTGNLLSPNIFTLIMWKYLDSINC